jgi:hypothetical protein
MLTEEVIVRRDASAFSAFSAVKNFVFFVVNKKSEG